MSICLVLMILVISCYVAPDKINQNTNGDNSPLIAVELSSSWVYCNEGDEIYYDLTISWMDEDADIVQQCYEFRVCSDYDGYDCPELELDCHFLSSTNPHNLFLGKEGTVTVEDFPFATSFLENSCNTITYVFKVVDSLGNESNTTYDEIHICPNQ